MPIRVIRQDLTTIPCDALVNPTNEQLLPGGGTDLAIHTAAGPELLEACIRLGGCATGHAKLTPAFRLPCRFVIHTVGPVWQGGTHSEEALLESCYRESLSLAVAYGCESIAFPLIASGSCGYPREEAFRVAINTIQEFLLEHDLLVLLAVFDRPTKPVSSRRFEEVQDYVLSRCRQELREFSMQSFPAMSKANAAPRPDKKHRFSRAPVFRETEEFSAMQATPSASLEEQLQNLDDGFAETLFRLIDQKGISDVECYKKAMVDKKTFSKIKCSKDYRPSKNTVLAFALALELSLEETRHLLQTVGFALSRSNKFDVILEYFISRGQYNIYDINEVLFEFDQPLIGC